MYQQEYDTLIWVINYCLKNRYPDGVNKDTKHHIKSQSKTFKVEGAELYHITKAGTVRTATRRDEAGEIINRIPYDIGGSHFGQERTIRKISER